MELEESISPPSVSWVQKPFDTPNVFDWVLTDPRDGLLILHELFTRQSNINNKIYTTISGNGVPTPVRYPFLGPDSTSTET